MPKRKRLEKAAIELKCEFSECGDICHGMSNLSAHIREHLRLMAEQLQQFNALQLQSQTQTFSYSASVSDETKDVDGSRILCPWRECNVVLEYTSNTAHCVRHVFYHGFHTYLKAMGASELQNRGIVQECCQNAANRNLIPDLPDELVCRWNACDFRTDDPWLFYKHAEVHGCSPSLENTWTCYWYGCKATVGSCSKLKEHIRTHTQEKLFACAHCGSLFCSATRLSDHISRQKSQNADGNMYQCSHCNKQFAVERLLKDHLRKHVNLYGCMFCEMSCPSPSALRIHILYRHSSERPYQCSHCDSRFKTKSDMSTHLLKHDMGGALLQCSVENCGYTCKSVTTFDKHTKEVHMDEDRVFGCHICEQLFTNSREISKHLRQQHSLKLPSGHVRFRFALDEDGVRRLVTVRYECIQDNPESELLDQSTTSEMSLLEPEPTTSNTILPEGT